MPETPERELIERLRLPKPEQQPGWWMIERDDNGQYRYWAWELPPGSKTWPKGFHIWVDDWQKGARFATKEEAEEARCGDITLPIREHGMMIEFVNPDGPDAADTIEALLSRVDKLEEALRAITREYEVYKEVGVDVMYDLAKDALNRSAS